VQQVNAEVFAISLIAVVLLFSAYIWWREKL
jgi:hypothetical protein